MQGLYLVFFIGANGLRSINNVFPLQSLNGVLIFILSSVSFASFSCQWGDSTGETLPWNSLIIKTRSTKRITKNLQRERGREREREGEREREREREGEREREEKERGTKVNITLALLTSLAYAVIASPSGCSLLLSATPTIDKNRVNEQTVGVVYRTI